MKKYIIFENSVFTKRLERKFYHFCLLRQAKLISFIPLFLVYNFLRFFRIVNREKYLCVRWSFLSLVKDLDKKTDSFFSKTFRKKLFVPENTTVLSEHPRVILERLFPSLIANIYSIGEKKFQSFKNATSFIEDSEYEAYGTGFSPLIREAKIKHYLYKQKEYFSLWSYILKTVLHYGFSYILMTAFSVATGIFSLYYACINHDNSANIFFQYIDRTEVLILNIAPIVFFCWLLYFITNSTFFSCLVSSGITMLFTWINYYKIFFRNDPFLFGDISIALEAKVMTESYKIVLTPFITVLIIVIIGFAVFMALYFRAPLKNLLVRLTLLLICVIIGIYSFNNIYMDSSLYTKTLNTTYLKPWAATDQFISRGFVYPFIYSAKTAYDTPPESYNEKTAQNILSQYTYKDIPIDKRVNIISVMLESWGDLSKFESIDFISDPYEMLDGIYEKSYSGELINDIFAAGTVTTERQFITGLNSISEFRKATNSVAWYFKDQGYTVEGGHPSYDWFYNRKNVNSNLGFENYYFDDNRYIERNQGNRLANNDVMFADIMTLFDESMAQNENYFSFNVTYEGHGPYAYDVRYETPYIVNKGYDDATFNNINNYLAKIESINKSVVWLADEVCTREEPIVLILFGDHMPGLGENNSGYDSLGINIDLSTTEGLKNYYTTPYIILANDTAKAVLENDFTGKGPTIGPYFLMNEFFNLAGYTGDEYMQYSTDMYERFQVYHSSGLLCKDGEFITDSSSEDLSKKAEYDIVQYYRRNEFVYG